MSNDFVQHKTFGFADEGLQHLAKEFEECTFEGVDLSAKDLSGINFSECTFNGCNLSMAVLTDTSFRDTAFNGCKMLGLHFDDCNPFGLTVSFEQCNLTHASFYRRKIKKMVFSNSQLHETDFTEADLSGAEFNNCDLMGAVFFNTILEKADLRTSVNYILDPEMNRIKKAKFSLTGLPGLLGKYDLVIS